MTITHSNTDKIIQQKIRGECVSLYLNSLVIICNSAHYAPSSPSCSSFYLSQSASLHHYCCLLCFFFFFPSQFHLIYTSTSHTIQFYYSLIVSPVLVNKKPVKSSTVKRKPSLTLTSVSLSLSLSLCDFVCVCVRWSLSVSRKAPLFFYTQQQSSKVTILDDTLRTSNGGCKDGSLFSSLPIFLLTIMWSTGQRERRKNH